MKEVVKWGGKVTPVIHIAMGVSMDRIAAHFVAIVLKKNNVTISMLPVPTDVIVAIEEVNVHKCAVIIHMEQNVR